MRVAVLSRNDGLLRKVRDALANDGAACIPCVDNNALLLECRRHPLSLILIDAGLDYNKNHTISLWRECHSDYQTPVVVIGEFRDRESISAAFAAGADDVVLMPAAPHELNLRLHIVLQRNRDRDRSLTHISMHGFALDKSRNTVAMLGDVVRLTAREFNMAWLFFSRPDHFFSRHHISEVIWGVSEQIAGRTLEQHIYTLRKKLRLDGASGVRLRTVYGLGYKLEVDQENISAMPTSPQTERPRECGSALTL